MVDFGDREKRVVWGQKLFILEIGKNGSFGFNNVRFWRSGKTGRLGTVWFDFVVRERWVSWVYNPDDYKNDVTSSVCVSQVIVFFFAYSCPHSHI